MRSTKVPARLFYGNLIRACIGFVPLLCCLLHGNTAKAQKQDTAGKMPVSLERAGFIVGFKTDSGDYQKFINDVILRQGTDTLYCDSAIKNNATNNFEAFGNVKIAQQGGTKGTSDYLKYTAAIKQAFMQGNVTLTDGKNTLECQELTYDLSTKTGIYDNWGTLYNDTTRVTSKKGVYNVNEKNAHFTGNVDITDPQYKIKSEDLVYNTETKVTQFYAKSVVTRDSGKSVLQTSNGSYDGKNGIAHFTGWSSIWNDGQYIEADSLDYNKLTGYGLANGHVVSIDTGHHSSIYCGHAEYFQKARVLWATVNPVLVQVNGKDTLYIAADTFYSAPMKKGTFRNAAIPVDTADKALMGATDTPAAAKPVITAPKRNDAAEERAQATAKGEKKGKGRKKTKKTISAESKIITDTTQADTTAPMYFIGYHHVLIFSDSLQGKCDSLCYTRSDSMIRMMYNPIAWSHNSQVTGDTILMQLDSSTLKSMYVPNNAYLVSQSGPEKAKFFDQVQGKTLTAWFSKSTITKVLVTPNAESIYYSKDDKGAYLGISQTTSVRLTINFNDQKIKKIKLDPDVHIQTTPIDKADIPGMKLSRFKWLIDQRPKSKEELFKR